MNTRILITVLVLLGGLYQILLSIVSYRSAKNPTPENLADIYDADTYTRWKNYSAEHSRLEILSAIIGCGINLVLLLSGAYAAFASLFPSGAFMQMFSVILLETIVGTAVGVVFSYVRTMKIEEKYGFNRSTMKTFVIDKIIDYAEQNKTYTSRKQSHRTCPYSLDYGHPDTPDLCHNDHCCTCAE